MGENVLKKTSKWQNFLMALIFFSKMWRGGANIKWRGGEKILAEIMAWWCGGGKILKVAHVAVVRTKKCGARPALLSCTLLVINIL